MKKMFFILLVVFNFSLVAQTFYLHAAYRTDWYGSGYLMSNVVTGYPQVTLQAQSAATAFVIEADASFNKWYNSSVNIDNISNVTWYNNYGAPGDNNLSSATTVYKYYTTVIKNNGYASSQIIVMETDNAPVSLSNQSQTPVQSVVSNNDDVTVSFSISATKSSQEKFYVRYTTNAWSTSTVVTATISSTTGSATIPKQSAGTTVHYYIFSSTFTDPTGVQSDQVTLRVLNNGGSNYSYTVFPGTKSGATNWSSTTSWESGSVPTSGNVIIGHNLSLDQDVTLDTIIIKDGATFTASSGSTRTLTITSGGSLTNSSSTFTHGSGIVNFAGAGTITGTFTFNNVNIAGGVNFGSSSTVDGTLTVNSSGFANTNGPSYGVNSTLSFNAGYTINSNDKLWPSSGSGSTIPYNVAIQSGKTIPMGTTGSLTARNNFNVFGVFTFGTTNADLTVQGNCTVETGGTLTLSSTSGSDLYLYGNFVNNGTFNSAQRAVFFQKDGTQTISGTTSPLSIDYVRIGGVGSTTVQLTTDNLSIPAANGGEVITFTNETDVFDLNGKTLTMGTAYKSSTISGSGSFKGSISSSMSILGTGDLGTLKFANDLNLLNLTMNKTSSGSVTLGSNLTINGALTVTSGDINTGSNTVTLASGASISEAAGHMVVGNIATSRTLSQNTNNDFGGLGVQINAAGASPGSTTVTRVTGTALTGNGNSSIKRYYQITPTANTGLNATLVFKYDNRASELNGITEDSLVLFRKKESETEWRWMGGTLNTTNKTITLTGVDTFSTWTAGGKDAPLPVELTSFAGNVVNGKVNLIWKTVTEVDNYGFEIERSSDNTTWKNIGFVAGNGNSNSPKEYSYTDNTVASGKYSYRLKQVDTDGSFDYSPVVEVDMGILPGGFRLEQNYPNPFNPSTSIKFAFSKDTKAALKIYNALGVEVREIFNGVAEAGRVYDINFNAAGLASGVYYYKLISPDRSDVRKMMLTK